MVRHCTKTKDYQTSVALYSGVKTISKIALASAISFTFLAVLSLVVLLPLYNSLTRSVVFEVVANEDVYLSKFLHHPEAWNRVYENVSTIPEYWNATVPPWLAGKSIPQIAALFLGETGGNDPEYAYCRISLPRLTSQALSKTFTELGFTIVGLEHYTWLEKDALVIEKGDWKKQ